MGKSKHQEYLNYYEIWDAVQAAFCNLKVDEVVFLNHIIVKATDIGGSYLLIQIERLECKEAGATKRDLETIAVSGSLNKVMDEVTKLAEQEEIYCWREHKGKSSVWCFKMLWDEDE